ncbi:tyrosine-type recombinase/integrase [Pantoea anthophila]|uniref:tyrosine-type recombinase/integrase n=1 Tax=Pantoea anthophila TaxID=470931 RepID=UPI000614DC8F|nr:tyrosine-type recombinase/integrase [Pantoea anthophila]KKB02846.1 Cre [Pantoea anthophila]
MTELVPLTELQMNRSGDIAERLRQFVQDKEAFSPNTWRQLLSVMRICNQWSEENQRSFLPMSADDLRDYLTFLAESGRASSTVTSHAALISMLHRNAGLPVPNTSPQVFRAMKKINRVAVMSGERAGQAVPFRLTDLLALDRQWSGADSLQARRDLAFLHVAYATLLRISELSRLRVRDVMRAGDGRIILDVAWTKTVVQTGGLIKALSTRSTQRLEEWLDASGLSGQPDAYLFTAVHRSGRSLPAEKPMSTRALEQIFERAWRCAGKAGGVKANKNRYTGWSGHSARVGAAQDMADKGYPIARIMQEGTWKKPETLMRYIRHVEAHKGAMVEFMEQHADDALPD